MKTVGTFEIGGSFSLKDRGLVIYGDVISGTISKDNFFTLRIGQNVIKLKIKGVDFLDNLKEKTAKIALTFFHDNDKQMQDLQTVQGIKQIAIITEL